MRGVRRWNEGGEVGWNRIGEEVGKLKKIGEGGGGDDYLVLENKQKNLLVLVTEHSNTLKRLL